MNERPPRSAAPVLVGFSLGAVLGSAAGYLVAQAHIWAQGVFHRVYMNDFAEGARQAAGICCGWVGGAAAGAGAGWLIRALRRKAGPR